MTIKKNIMGTTMNKAKVLNPILDHNTVGQELALILTNKQLNECDLLECLKLKKSLSDTKKFTVQQRQVIERFIGIDGFGKFLERFQNNYLETEKRITPLYEQYKMAYSNLKGVKEYLDYFTFQGRDILDDIVEFLGIEDELDKDAVAKALPETAVKYRKPSTTIDPLTVLAFLRKGDLDFQQARNDVQYNKDAFLEWLNDKSNWSNKLEDFNFIKNELAVKLSEFGIVLSLAKSLPKSVFGATRWINRKPLIQVSDREKNLAVFWYTLFHEFGHMVLHEGIDMMNEGESISKNRSQKQEVEANRFANEHLCNNHDINSIVFGFKNNLKSFNLDMEAKNKEVHEMFFLFRMNKLQYFVTSEYKNRYNKKYEFKLSIY